MTKRALVVRGVAVLGLVLRLGYLLVLWRHVYRMGIELRLENELRLMALLADDFRSDVGRYPTNLSDMASYDAGYGSEFIREWAQERIDNDLGDHYDIESDDDGFSVMMSRPGTLLLPSLMVSNRFKVGEARDLFSPRSRERDSGELDRPQGEMESVDE